MTLETTATSKAAEYADMTDAALRRDPHQESWSQRRDAYLAGYAQGTEDAKLLVQAAARGTSEERRARDRDVGE